MKRTASGQEVIEFALISGLIFSMALFSTILFGDKIANFFDKNPASANTDTESRIFSQGSISNAIVTPNPSTSIEISSSNSIQENADLINTIANNLPNINSTIKTSGASGATDTITDQLDALVTQLKTMAEKSSDPAINDLYLKGVELANTGHIVADAQEWIEYSAIRTESDDTVTLPSSNQLCQYGELESSVGHCDQDIVMQDMLTSGFDVIGANLTNWNDKFNEINNDLQINAYKQTDDVKMITSLINELALEIDEISNNVYIEAQKNTNIDSLLNAVASSTTDIKAELIQSASDLLANQESKP